jgi:type IV secretory pathway TrbD component
MAGTLPIRRNRVFKSLHKPLTYLGIERRIFFCVAVVAVALFNVSNSLIAGFVVFIGGMIFGYWVTNTDTAYLTILMKSGKFKARYDAAKQQLPNVEIR